MEMIKLVNGKGDIIERKKIDYTPNIKIWEQRGWKPYVEPKVEPKPEPKSEPTIDYEWQKSKPILKENESQENFEERLTGWENAKPKKKSKKKGK